MVEKTQYERERTFTGIKNIIQMSKEVQQFTYFRLYV